MRKLLATAVVFGVMLGMCSNRAAAVSETGVPQTDWMNEATIRKLYDEFEAAWNRHDTNKMASMWAIDGDHLEPDGKVAKGRGEVETLFKNQHATVFKGTHLDLKIDSVWFITSNVALVDGTYDLAGVTTPDGKVLEPRKGHLTSVLMQEQDQKWWIAASRLMIPVSLPYKK